jgi:hypothetical protein
MSDSVEPKIQPTTLQPGDPGWEPFPDDRPTYAYLVEGEPSAGTLADWAHAVEQAHYAGLFVSRTVWRAEDGDLVPMVPGARQLPPTGDDYGVTIYNVGDDIARVRIDLRA